MLFLPQSIYDARRKLWREFQAGKLTGEVLYPKMLDLDPDDFIGLAGTAKLRVEGGDLAGAEEYCWRAIQSNPCVSEPYLALAQTLNRQPESQALAMALAELAILKRSRDQDGDEFLKDLDFGKAGLQGEFLETFRALPAPVQGELIARSMQKERTDEPLAVTERLRGLRLIEQMQSEGALEAETVDAIIAEGAAMVPLLVGVLRAWAQDFLDEDGDDDLENALALLGEIGSPNEIPHLLEFVDLKNQTASGASSWALGRIVERLPAESAQFIEPIAGRLSVAERLKVAEQTFHNPGFDPEGKLLERLSQDLGSMEKADRDVLFPLLLVTMATARGRAGLAMARAALRRQAGLLSRSTRRECEDLLAACEEFPNQPPEESSSWTVYEICAGDAVWDEDEDEEEDGEDDEEEDDFLPAPEPVRRRATPGRNDPCWCNSGRKYKKCHLESDEREGRQTPGEAAPVLRGTDDFSSLRRNIGEFLGQVLPQRERKQSLEEFFGDGPAAETESEIPLLDWMIHDRISASLGQTVMEEFLERRGPRLTPRERGMVEAWSRSYIGLYEVQQLKAGVGVQLKDLIFGKDLFVHDINVSTKLTKWDGILARVVPGERGTELAGSTLTVPRMHLQQFREWMEDDREESGLEWREYLKANWPRIRRRSFEIAANWMESLQLSNTDGEELLLSKATYRVTDEVAVTSALQLCPELTDDSPEDESDMRSVWLNEEKTVLGNIRIGSGELTLETNSRERLERGKRLISDLAGAGLRHVHDEFTTQKDLKHGMKDGPRDPPAVASEIPKEVRDKFLRKAAEKHYAGWPDTKLPALRGKTPRQAVKTAHGRKEVIELLKLIENGEERKRNDGEPWYDVARLRTELGLD